MNAPVRIQDLSIPRHDWRLDEVEALFARPFMELVFDAAAVHRRWQGGGCGAPPRTARVFRVQRRVFRVGIFILGPPAHVGAVRQVTGVLGGSGSESVT